MTSSVAPRKRCFAFRGRCSTRTSCASFGLPRSLDPQRAWTMSDLSNHRLASGVDVGRRTAPRTVVGMSGHYVLNGWRDAEGAPRRFPCAIRNMSPKVLTITAPVSGSVGEWIVASFEKLGQFEGPILQVLNRALAMRIVATNEDRAKVAKKIAWLTGA